jgi:alcohol dehydrogenase
MSARFGALRLGSHILFGAGSIRAAGPMAARFGRRVAVCTDKGVASTPGFARLIASLEGADLRLQVFDSGAAELPRATAEQAAASCAAFDPDVVIGVGGGSSLDLAKLTSLLLTHHQPLDTFYGEDLVPGPVRPVIAIPTTAGTGSEVTPVAVVSDPSRRLKVGIASAHLIPRGAICDPEMTHGCPARVSALAGIDALAHAIEAFTAIERPIEWAADPGHIFVGKNRLSDAFALSAIEHIARDLAGAVTSDEPAAREGMLYASLLAGLAFGTAGTTLAHAIQYPVGAATATPHGLGVGVVLPYVLAYNRGVRAAALASVGIALGAGPGADEAIAGVVRLCAAVGIPRSLADIGVRRDECGAIAAQALQVTRLVQNNARPLDEVSMLDVVAAAWHGDLERLRR